MQTFTIENETNNITIHATGAEAEAVLDSERFATEAELADLAANWLTGRLVEIWNSLPGVTVVRKFKDRATAVSRIWKAIQPLGEALPHEAAELPEAASVTEPQPEADVEVPAVEPIATEPEATQVEAEPVASLRPTLTRSLRHKRPTLRRRRLLRRPGPPARRRRPPRPRAHRAKGAKPAR
jgi:hypothetical protein